MDSNLVPFQVTRLQATVPGGVPLEWQGKAFDSDDLIIELDDTSGEVSKGMLDYSRQHASAEFHVSLKFPEFAKVLESFGVSSELTQPVRAILRSEGEILPDHSFILSGKCTVDEHGLFSPSETAASVLPGQ